MLFARKTRTQLLVPLLFLTVTCQYLVMKYKYFFQYFIISLSISDKKKKKTNMSWTEAPISGHLPEIYDSPQVGSEPHGGATVSLVFPDQDGVGHRE